MDEENSKQHTPQENPSSRSLPDLADKVDHSKKEADPGDRSTHQSPYYIWRLSRFEFLSIVLGAITFVAVSGAVYVSYKQRQDTLQKERARIVLAEIKRESDAPLSFSLIFKNAGATTALRASGLWLSGECLYSSPQECQTWCLEALRKQGQGKGEGYGPILAQETHERRFSFPLKTGKERKKQKPIYLCGSVSYVDVFCVWRKQVYGVYYDPSVNDIVLYPTSKEDQEAQVTDCHS